MVAGMVNAGRKKPYDVPGNPGKKGAAVAGGSKVFNREASNRVDRSHSMSMKMDD